MLALEQRPGVVQRRPFGQREVARAVEQLAQACKSDHSNFHSLATFDGYRLLAATSLLLAVSTARGAAASQCTAETLAVQGTPVTIAYCVTGAPRSSGTQEIAVPVVGTFSAIGRSVSSTSELHFLAGERVSRVLQSFDLTALGLEGTLHLTLAYAQGLVRIDGALLTPGAITIK
jgi:hypothetical protein